MRRRSLRALAAVVLAAGSLIAVERARDDGAAVDGGGVAGPALPGDARDASVERVVDGDTVVLSGAGKARLIGVDTPEVYGQEECFGADASQYSKRQLDGRTVRYAVGKEARDRYGRLLAYLWLKDGRSFNAMLVARGYATPLTIEPNSRYARTFARLASRARERGEGLWGGCPR
jgi:micrococcal nuclease